VGGIGSLAKGELIGGFSGAPSPSDGGVAKDPSHRMFARWADGVRSGALDENPLFPRIRHQGTSIPPPVFSLSTLKPEKFSH